jgi:hypothetical protein
MEKRVRFSDKPPNGKKIPQSLPYKKLNGTQSLPSKRPKVPKPQLVYRCCGNFCGMVIWPVRTAWWFVSPVFNPRSTLKVEIGEERAHVPERFTQWSRWYIQRGSFFNHGASYKTSRSSVADCEGLHQVLQGFDGALGVSLLWHASVVSPSILIQSS